MAESRAAAMAMVSRLAELAEEQTYLLTHQYIFSRSADMQRSVGSAGCDKTKTHLRWEQIHSASRVGEIWMTGVRLHHINSSRFLTQQSVLCSACKRTVLPMYHRQLSKRWSQEKYVM